MTAKMRILLLRLLEKQQKHPDYAKRIGVQVRMKRKEADHV